MCVAQSCLGVVAYPALALATVSTNCPSAIKAVPIGGCGHVSTRCVWSDLRAWHAEIGNSIRL
eukprot:3219988-Alexandrium_andersonii.AAC.1